MKTLTHLITIITVITLGLSSGAMLTEAVVLVGYWRSLPPQEFLNWFKSNEPLLTSFFGTLQILSLVLTVISIGLFRYLHRSTSIFLVSVVFSVLVLATYFLYFKGVNTSFLEGTIKLDMVANELIVWGLWQWIRTALGVGAFITAILATQEKTK